MCILFYTNNTEQLKRLFRKNNIFIHVLDRLWSRVHYLYNIHTRVLIL